MDHCNETKTYEFTELCDFVLPAVLSLPHANADCERIFSFINGLKTKISSKLITDIVNVCLSVALALGIYFIRNHPAFKGEVTSSKIWVVFYASARLNFPLINVCILGPSCNRISLIPFSGFGSTNFRSRLMCAKCIDMCPYSRNIDHTNTYYGAHHRMTSLNFTKLKTVTYGLNCAMFLALRVLQDLAEQECAELPVVLDTLTY